MPMAVTNTTPRTDLRKTQMNEIKETPSYAYTVIVLNCFLGRLIREKTPLEYRPKGDWCSSEQGRDFFRNRGKIRRVSRTSHRCIHPSRLSMVGRIGQSI